eukprot:4479273-Pyramimonas_sp.AAC.1
MDPGRTALVAMCPPEPTKTGRTTSLTAFWAKPPCSDNLLLRRVLEAEARAAARNGWLSGSG